MSSAESTPGETAKSCDLSPQTVQALVKEDRTPAPAFVKPAVEPATRFSFNTLRSFALDILTLLESRKKTHQANAHPMCDKFGDKQEELAVSRGKAEELGELYWEIRRSAEKVLSALETAEPPKAVKQCHEDAQRYRYVAKHGWPDRLRQVHPTEEPATWGYGDGPRFSTPEAAIDAARASQTADE